MKTLNDYPTPLTDDEAARVRANCDELIHPVEADFARDLERKVAMLREALEEIAKETKRVSIPCSDPQCGDSTSDHECDASSEYRPTMAATIARGALDATKP